MRQLTPPLVDRPDTLRGFRNVAGRFATGVAVATTRVDGTPVGMTVNSFTTVSLEPTLVLVCIDRRARLLSAIARSAVFALMVLAADQQGQARWFATRGRPTGFAEFAGARYHLDARTGCPLLSDGIAYFGCALYGQHPAGDHDVLIGAVQSYGLLRDAPPLLFVDGHYAEVTAEPR